METTRESTEVQVPAGATREPLSLERIRFQDCDPFGHLNNARYLDYFINAREGQLLAHYDLDVYSRRFMERNWVVRTSQVTHLLPARHNEVVAIQTRMMKKTSNAILIEGVMMDRERTRILAVSWVEFRYIDLKTGRPARHEADLMAMFAAIETAPDFEIENSKARVNELKKALKGAQGASASASSGAELAA